MFIREGIIPLVTKYYSLTGKSNYIFNWNRFSSWGIDQKQTGTSFSFCGRLIIVYLSSLHFTWCDCMEFDDFRMYFWHKSDIPFLTSFVPLWQIFHFSRFVYVFYGNRYCHKRTNLAITTYFKYLLGVIHLNWCWFAVNSCNSRYCVLVYGY